MTRPFPLNRWPLLLAMTILLAACAVPASRYLSVGPTEIADAVLPEQAVVLIHPFTESFSADFALGSHHFSGNRRTKLLVEPGSVSQALTANLHRELMAQAITVTLDGDQWNKTPEGLVSFIEPNRLLVSGDISRLTLNVEEKLFSGKAVLEMEVECLLGIIQEKKVIRRRVHVAQEMITLSFGREELEKLLIGCLAEASKEILAQCHDFVALLPTVPSRTTTNSPRRSPGDERTS